MANYFIIAATSDIGSECCRQLKQQGHHLYLCGRDNTRLEEVAKQTQSAYQVVDATDFEAVLSAAAHAKTDLGSIDGVVCFSGSLLLKNAANTSYNEYLQTVHANLTTAFATIRAASKVMVDGGNIVLFSSAVAMHGIANHEAIAASKAGVIGLAISAAASFASKNIRVNVVAPGMTNTRLTKDITSNKASLNFSKQMHALKQIANIDDIVNTVIFLLGSKHITGQVIAVDGGLSKVAPKIKV
ncbi:MAG: SDR family oxidoreductase [Pseudomonadota bacterium]